MLADKIKTYDYDYYQGLAEDKFAELIDGIIYNMSPAPSFSHQLTSSFLHREISIYLKGKQCKVFHAPFDVYFINDNQDISECKNIVQPDITVICDKNKFHEKGCKGAPDFIIEIVSMSTKSHDYVRKLNLYNEYKVKEYWIVNPISRTISVYTADESGFSEPIKYTFKDKINVHIFQDLEVDFSDLEFL